MSTSEYNRIIEKSSEYTDHRKFVSPISNPEIPTAAAYKNGRMTRYFVISEIDNRVVEIDQQQFDTVKNPTKGISPHLWKPVKMKWKLTGPRTTEYTGTIIKRKGVIDVNRATLNKLLEKNPKLSRAITSLELYAMIEGSIQTNLIAGPNELVYADDPTRSYEGPYHVHPEKGPMEGATHSPLPHAKLMFVSELEDIVDQQTETPPLPDTPSYSPPAGGGSSGGGGGGGGY